MFLRISTLQNTSGRLPPCFVSFFSANLVKKSFWMILQYFNNSSCKLSLWIVRLSQLLLVYCYLKWQFLQCHRQPGALQRHFEISVPSVNNHPSLLTYSKNYMKINRVCTLFFFVWLCRVTMTRFNLLLIFEESNIATYVDDNIPLVLCENIN